MKLPRILAWLLASVLITSYTFPPMAVHANTLSEMPENNSDASDVLTDENSSPETDSVIENYDDVPTDEDSTQETDSVVENYDDVSTDEDSTQETDSVIENDSDEMSDEDTTQNMDSVIDSMPDSGSVSENHCSDSPETASAAEDAAADSETAVLSDRLLPEEKPPFSASITHQFDGYAVKGHFADFLPDTTFVQPQSSLDGDHWQDCGVDWRLSFLGDEDPDALHSLQNQICLYDRFEPLKSYLAGDLDSFYLRLRITRENGVTYETQAALIERGAPTPVPEEITCTAGFASSMLFREVNSSGAYTYCGRYQLTVNASAAPEDITALLPDTLPVQVELRKGKKAYAECIIDCPVTWKTVSLPVLTAGTSVTLRDAAEEIVIPAGTVLSTPTGTFTLDAPLGIEQGWWMTDEVILVLNVVPEDGNPTGVLSLSDAALQMAFDLKPTGATAIRAYILNEGDAEWTELSGLPLLDAVNAQPTTANSGYTTILNGDEEPYRSYLAAKFAKEDPHPFFVGLKIEGGVYDGRQLILACPDTYDLPPDLLVNGSGGNEGNAGVGNRDDSTAEGQRPNLPHEETKKPSEQQPDSLPNATGGSGNSQADLTGIPADIPGTQQADSFQPQTGNTGTQQTDSFQPSTVNAGAQQASSFQPQTDNTGIQQTDSFHTQTDNTRIQQTDSFQISTDDTNDTTNPNIPSNDISGQERQSGQKNSSTQKSSDVSTITQAIPDNIVEESARKPLLPIVAGTVMIGGIYLIIAVTRIIRRKS